jgi:hypothetical protein
MFTVTVEDPEIEPEPEITLKIHPSLLLKVRYFSLGILLARVWEILLLTGFMNQFRNHKSFFLFRKNLN